MEACKGSGRIFLAVGLLFLVLVFVQTPVSAGTGDVEDERFIDHAGEVLPYNGAATCIECHEQQVATFGSSNHFLWHGKMNQINDFCTYPNINLGLSKLTTVFGTLVDGGCLACHSSLGGKPVGSDPLNADCLTCHAAEYRRTVALVDGAYVFVPNYAAMPETITIQARPTRYACLTCHASSGGGHNNKRGDITLTLVNPLPENDVHMGNGLLCVDCHQTENHRIAGQGADLRIDEGTPMRPCTDCHNIMKAHKPDIKQHLSKVACQSCHIPAYARSVSTDMIRDHHEAEINAKGLYEPAIIRGSNVVPVYAIWNGESEFYEFGEPAVEDQAMAKPMGNIQDGKLYPFRLHETIMPQDPVSKALLPVKSSILFQFGDMYLSILTGAKDAGFDLTDGYTYVTTWRWMGIYHEMPTASEALTCTACHDEGGRVDFSALGYDPKTFRNNKPLCVSCHEKRENLEFYALHDQHAKGRRINCSQCHTFSR